MNNQLFGYGLEKDFINPTLEKIIDCNGNREAIKQVLVSLHSKLDYINKDTANEVYNTCKGAIQEKDNRIKELEKEVTSLQDDLLEYERDDIPPSEIAIERS